MGFFGFYPTVEYYMHTIRLYLHKEVLFNFLQNSNKRSIVQTRAYLNASEWLMVILYVYLSRQEYTERFARFLICRRQTAISFKLPRYLFRQLLSKNEKRKIGFFSVKAYYKTVENVKTTNFQWICGQFAVDRGGGQCQ